MLNLYVSAKKDWTQNSICFLGRFFEHSIFPLRTQRREHMWIKMLSLPPPPPICRCPLPSLPLPILGPLSVFPCRNSGIEELRPRPRFRWRRADLGSISEGEFQWESDICQKHDSLFPRPSPPTPRCGCCFAASVEREREREREQGREELLSTWARFHKVCPCQMKQEITAAQVINCIFHKGFALQIFFSNKKTS